MITKSGKGVFGGIAFGYIKIVNDKEEVKRYFISDSTGEKKRFEKARKKAYEETLNLLEKTKKTAGEKEAAIFEIHSIMINDDEFVSMAESIIDGGINAEAAVYAAGEELYKKFASIDDDYMSQRANDIKDVSSRIINAFDENINDDIKDENVIIVSTDLTPSQTVQMREENIAGFITEYGSLTSHTAILARMMNIPAVVCAKGIVDEAYNGKFAALDSASGSIYIEPNESTIKRLKDKKERNDTESLNLQKYKGK